VGIFLANLEQTVVGYNAPGITGELSRQKLDLHVLLDVDNSCVRNLLYAVVGTHNSVRTVLLLYKIRRLAPVQLYVCSRPTCNIVYH